MVENLTLYYLNKNSKQYILKDVCFSLNGGDSLGIISKSGDGKSTLAKALLKIYDNNIRYESGRITLDNKEIDETYRGTKIALLFQNPNSYLNPLMKVGKQIEEMLVYHYKESKKVARIKTIALMEEAGIEKAKEIYSYYPHEISGGMQQRICLCIALICHPKVLILDECTSYLDNDSKLAIINLIKKMQIKYKFSLIVISHDFKDVYSMCGKIAIMRKGQMIEFGNKDEIILNPIHPYTIELLYTYLRYKENVDAFNCPLMEIETLESAPITSLSPSHYVRSWYLDKRAVKVNLPCNLSKIKENIYESLRN